MWGQNHLICLLSRLDCNRLCVMFNFWICRRRAVLEEVDKIKFLFAMCFQGSSAQTWIELIFQKKRFRGNQENLLCLCINIAFNNPVSMTAVCCPEKEQPPRSHLIRQTEILSCSLSRLLFTSWCRYEASFTNKGLLRLSVILPLVPVAVPVKLSPVRHISSDNGVNFYQILSNF